MLKREIKSKTHLNMINRKRSDIIKGDDNQENKKWCKKEVREKE